MSPIGERRFILKGHFNLTLFLHKNNLSDAMKFIVERMVLVRMSD